MNKVKLCLIERKVHQYPMFAKLNMMTCENADKMKVLHVLGGLDRGGAETWLMHVLRHIDRDRLQFDFLVHTQDKCAYDDEARELGARIIPNPNPRNPFLYAFNFIRNYRKYGPYDVVHSHVHHYSGFVLFLAKVCGAKKRIAHSHSNTRSVERNSNSLRKAYLKLMELLIRGFATRGIAASRMAAESLFGPHWENDRRWTVIHCGIDLKPFEGSWRAEDVRGAIGLPDGSFVLGHVGRFHEQKNHPFLIDVAQEVFEKIPDSYLLLVGDGPLRPTIEEKARRKGFQGRVVFAGIREDIPRVMRAMDVFVMPSLYEGLGIVIVEAQASGLPCLISDVIPKEADVIKENIFRLSLTDPPSVWADRIVDIKNHGAQIKQEECLERLRNSSFNIGHCVSQLEELYGLQ